MKAPTTTLHHLSHVLGLQEWLVHTLCEQGATLLPCNSYCYSGLSAKVPFLPARSLLLRLAGVQHSVAWLQPKGAKSSARNFALQTGSGEVGMKTRPGPQEASVGFGAAPAPLPGHSRSVQYSPAQPGRQARLPSAAHT